jgi:hypothetical protein
VLRFGAMSLPDLSLRGRYRRSARQGSRLKIGVLVDSYSIERRWYEVLANLRESTFADIVCVIESKRPGPNAAPPASPDRRGAMSWNEPPNPRTALFSAYTRWAGSRYAQSPDPAERVDCSTLLRDNRSGRNDHSGNGAPLRLAAEDTPAIERCCLDVILSLVPRAPGDRVTLPSRCGTWSLIDGDSDEYCGGSGFVWELIEGNPRTAVELICNEPGSGRELRLARLATRTANTRHVAANRFGPFWLGAHLVIRKLKELFERGWEQVRANAIAPNRYQGRRNHYATPRNAAMLEWAARLAVRRLRRRNPARPYWQIGIRRSDVPLYAEPTATQLRSFRMVTGSAGGFLADPFLCENDGRIWLFVERYEYEAERGHIACAEVRADGSVSAPEPVLTAAWHLSYPVVVRDGGSIYMIPESSESGGVDLYRAEEFPHRWTRVRRIVDFAAVDVTPHRGNDCWWMFVTPVIVPGHEHVLLLFKSRSIEGPWEEVASSPIVADPVGSRGAGLVISNGGRLIRPCQNCGDSYGGALQFREIERLSADDYRERVVADVSPDFAPGLSGIHTYNRAANIEVIDVRLARGPR